MERHMVRQHKTPPLALHSGDFPPYGGLLITCDEETCGTVSCFCRTSSGKLYGVCCAHVLQNAGQPVQLWDINENFQTVGNVQICYEGTQVDGQDGKFDAGLFTLENNVELQERAQNAQPLQTASPVVGERLTGRGESDGGPNGRILHGTVKDLDEDVDGTMVDVKIAVDAPGISKGDSGMLWRNASGQAVALHMAGVSDVDSPFSYAMRASRLVDHFDITLLWG
jgi:hypothetical protein